METTNESFENKNSARMPPLTPAAPAEKKSQSVVGKVKSLSGKQKLLAIIVICAVLLGIARTAYRLVFFESTDDSFITADVHTVSSRVMGSVSEILVHENQKVKKGDVLVKLDPRDYLVQIKAAQASYSKAHKDIARFSGYTNDLGPTERPVFDQYTANALVSEAALEKAQLQYEYTTITASADGVVGHNSVEVGDMIQPGQAMMPLVEQNSWVVANFKEGQLAHIRIGQKVEISVDAISGKSFTGTVQSIAPGSGSTFSLLPPDNATGNFTKIVQRIPIKIILDADSVKGYEDQLVPGMSTEVSVKVK